MTGARPEEDSDTLRIDFMADADNEYDLEDDDGAELEGQEEADTVDEGGLEEDVAV